MRLNLKLAIIRTCGSQRRAAALCHIPENRISELVCGWADPNATERDALTRVLGSSPDLLERDPAAMEVRSVR
jgi:plasmid maintenance system antidote protein VapI